MPLFRDDKRPRGFTLIEVLISTVLLALIVAMLGGLLSQVSTVWQRSSQQSESRRSVRAIFDFISTDLRSALLSVDPAGDPGKGNLQFVVNPPLLGNAYRHPDAIFWQAPVATDGSLGDVAEIGYFVRWDKTNEDNPRARLCRLMVNPTDTTHYRISSDVNEDLSKDLNEWVKPELLDQVAMADEDSGYRGLLAEDVIGFWVRCGSGDGSWIASYDSRGKDTRRLPAVVEISLVQLDGTGARKVTKAMQGLLERLTRESNSATTFLTALRASPDFAALAPHARLSSIVVGLENAP